MRYKKRKRKKFHAFRLFHTSCFTIGLIIYGGNITVLVAKCCCNKHVKAIRNAGSCTISRLKAQANKFPGLFPKNREKWVHFKF